MEHENHLQNLNELKRILAKNTRFLSFSGLSGIIAGALALIGLWLFVELAYSDIKLSHENYFLLGLSIGLSIIILAIGCGIVLTRRRIKKEGTKVNQAVVKNTLIHILLPIVAGGITCLILAYQGQYTYVPALMLLFYGIGLFNGSQFSFDDLKYMGLRFISLGILTLLMPQWSMWTWGVGFGLFHILYGLRIYFKHERKTA